MRRAFAVWLVAAFVMMPVAASADPISTAIVSVFAKIGVAVKVASVTAFLANTVVSLGLSLLSRALSKKPKTPEQGGVRIEGTTVGEDTPQKFPLGRYLTGGHLEYHGSWDDGSGTPNRFYTRVYSLSDVPGVSLRRVLISDDWTDLGDDAHPEFGFPMLKYRRVISDYAWVKFYDGHQTEVDPYLLARFGNDPDQPWSSSSVGYGVAYAIVTLQLDREQFSGVPAVAFELDSVPVYDPRKDTSIGGDGPQRRSDVSTWEPSDNPAVLAYNLCLGIPMPDGSLYGGGVSAEDLPLSNAVAGMNVCDELVGTGGITRPRYQAGVEVSVDVEPAEYIEELMRAGHGQVAEVGGVFLFRWGSPDLPQMYITDGDISISEAQEFDPFPGLEETYNAVRVTHPSPEHKWEPLQTPPDYNATWEEEDGGRRLAAQLNVPACFDHGQAQQLASGYALDHRRWRRHVLTLPSDAFDLRPLDTIAWTSERNGYQNKIFEIVSMVYRPFSHFCRVTLRERDPLDYDWDTEVELPSPPTLAPAEPPVRVVGATEWDFTAEIIQAPGGTAERPALAIHVDPGGVEDASAVHWQVVYELDESHVAAGSFRAGEETVLIASGIFSDTSYKARIRLQMEGQTNWTGWKSARTGLVDDGLQELRDLFNQKDAEARETLESFNRNFAFAFDRYAEFDVLGRAGAFLDNARTEGKVEQVKTDLSVDIDTVSAQITQTMTALTDLDVAFSAYKLEVQSDFDDVTAFVDQNIYTIAEADAAIAAQTSSLTTQVNGLNTTVQSVNQSVNGILGQAGWHINNNGVMSGFGLMSELVNGQVTSEILLNADNIRFVNSSGVGAASSPFQVVGSETFIKSAFILDASVGTLKIAGNAITVPVFAQGGLLTGNGSFQNGVTALINLPETGDVIILWSVEQGYAQSGPSWGFRILANGVEIASRTGMTAVNDYPGGYAVLPNVSGSQTIQFQWLGSNGQVTGRPSLQLVGRMR